MKPLFALFLFAFLSLNSAFALEEFLCQCKAKAPGYEETNRKNGSIDKICSYSCKCIAWDLSAVDPKTKTTVAKNVTPNLSLDIINEATTATSKESWDFGSHVCHGQYSYRGSLSDPNWKIAVKFDTFTVNTAGVVSYPEDAKRQIAMGISESGFKYSKTATEISASLKAQLKKF